MERKDVAAIAGVVAVAEAVLFFCIPVFWHAAVSFGHVIGTVITGAHWIAGFVEWIVALFLLVILIIVGAILVISGYLLIIRLLETIVASLRELATKFDEFSAHFSRNARDTAIDAGFVVVLGIVGALVAYVNTEDFLAKMTMLKILAVASMCYASLKAVMLIPIRTTQILSGALMLGILAVTTTLLHHKHPLYPISQPNGVTDWFLTAELAQVISASAIVTLSALSILYPFTWRGWKRILSLS
jgi:hypothetical protein